MKINNILRNVSFVAGVALLFACNNGAGGAASSSSAASPASVTTTLNYGNVQQYASPVVNTGNLMSIASASNCLSINSLSTSGNAWWVSGTFNIYNSCSTQQSASGLQITFSAQNGLSSSSNALSLNSVNGLYFPPPIYWAATTMSTSPVVVSGVSDLLGTLSTSGYILPSSNVQLSFGYNAGGVAPVGFSVSLSGVTPVVPGNVNFALNTTALKSVCTGSVNCNIPVVLLGQSGQFSQTIATLTNSNVGSILKYNIESLVPGSNYQFAVSNLPANVQFNPPSAFTVTSGQTIAESASFTVLPPTTGNLNFTLTNPSGFAESMALNLVNSSSQVVASLTNISGNLMTFSNILAGKYTLTSSYGLADAISGTYYNPLSVAESIVAGQTTVGGNINFQKNSNVPVNVTLQIESLGVGENALVTLTDNFNGQQFTYNQFNAANGNTALKLLQNDSVTINVQPSISGKYVPIAPTTYVIKPNQNIVVQFESAHPLVGFIDSPYKDVTINMNWNTYIISTAAGSTNGTIQPLVSVLQAQAPIKTVTWAFATGECGSENWAGVSPAEMVVNIPLFQNAGMHYIISTGGQNGVFTCGSQAGMAKFLSTYMSPAMVGIDFDMEGGQTPSQLASLMSQLIYAQSLYPNLRISFTLATLGASDGSYGGLNSLGNSVIVAANTAGLKNYYVNLMVMDYGSVGASVCVAENGLCNMSKSAIQAVQNLEHTYGIPANRIEVTPMIGNNDSQGEVFSLTDASILANYVISNGLAGLHFWSLDRDTPCSSGITSATAICNTSSTGNLQYTNKFLSIFHQ